MSLLAVCLPTHIIRNEPNKMYEHNNNHCDTDKLKREKDENRPQHFDSSRIEIIHISFVSFTHPSNDIARSHFENATLE